MSARLPRVSIGMPVFNGEPFIDQALASLHNQTFADFELIISDNASTDRTREICERWAACDPRIRYHRSELNRGAAWNFNRVFKLSRGEYFHWHAHDDLLLPNFLEKTVALLDRRPEVLLVSTKVQVINDSGKRIKILNNPLKTNSPQARVRFRSLVLDFHLCFEIFGLIRASALRQTSLIGNFGHGDGILLEQLSLLGPFFELPEPLFEGRIHRRQSMTMYGVLGKKKWNDYHSYTVWFDPCKAGKVMFPTWRILREHILTLWHGPIHLTDRLYGMLFLLCWIFRRRTALLKDLLIAAALLWMRSNEAHPVKASPQGSQQ